MRAAQWIVGVTIAGTALAFNPRMADSFGLVKALVLVVGVTSAATCIVLWKIETQQPFPRVSGVVPLTVLLAAMALATALSHNPRLSLVGAYTRYTGLVTVVLLVALAAVTAVAFAFDVEGRRKLLTAMVATAVVVALYAIVQRLGYDAFDFRDVTGLKPDFPGSTVGNSLFAGSVCGMAFPLAVALGLSAATRERVAFACACVVLIGGLWATQSRSGMLGAAAGAALIALGTPSRWRRLLAVGCVAWAAVVAVFAVVVLWHPGMDSAPGGLADRQVLRTESLVIRGGEWSAAERVWLSRPLIGTGPETFASESPRYRSAGDARRFGLRIADKPHNIFLEYLASAGVVGFAAFAFLIGAAARLFARARRGRAAPERAAVLAAGALCLSYVVGATFSFDTPGTTPWAFLALGVAMAASARPGRPVPPAMRSRAKGVVARVDASPWFARVGAAVVAVGLFTIAARIGRADLEAARGLRATSLTRASQHFGRAISLNPTAANYRAQAGEIAEQWAARLPQRSKPTALRVSVARHAQAVDAEPGNVIYALGLARAQTSLAVLTGDASAFATAERSWRSVIRNDRSDWQLINEHALALNGWANAFDDGTIRRRAIRELERVVALKPDYLSGWVNLARLSSAVGDHDAAARAARRALDLHPDARVVSELRSYAVTSG
jgi:O-antigen ligase